jgi:hypothetical protein
MLLSLVLRIVVVQVEKPDLLEYPTVILSRPTARIWIQPIYHQTHGIISNKVPDLRYMVFLGTNMVYGGISMGMEHSRVLLWYSIYGADFIELLKLVISFISIILFSIMYFRTKRVCLILFVVGFVALGIHSIFPPQDPGWTPGELTFRMLANATLVPCGMLFLSIGTLLLSRTLLRPIPQSTSLNRVTHN